MLKRSPLAVETSKRAYRRGWFEPSNGRVLERTVKREFPCMFMHVYTYIRLPDKTGFHKVKS